MSLGSSITGVGSLQPGSDGSEFAFLLDTWCVTAVVQQRRICDLGILDRSCYSLMDLQFVRR